MAVSLTNLTGLTGTMGTTDSIGPELLTNIEERSPSLPIAPVFDDLENLINTDVESEESKEFRRKATFINKYAMHEYRPILPQYVYSNYSVFNSVNRRNRLYQAFFQQSVIVDFENLHTRFPRVTVTGSSLLSFGKLLLDDKIVVLYAGEVPLLELRSETKEDHTYRNKRSIFLHRIYKYQGYRWENMKRLFLRHLGFKCIRYNGKTKIYFSESNVITLKKNEDTILRDYSGKGTLVGSVLIH